MSLQGNWLTRGYFDLRNADGGQTVTQQVRDNLADHLGQPRRAVKIRSYPVGPAWRHTVWWGEGEVGFPEAQFIMRTSEEYPILSVGLSVEKGMGTPRVGAPKSDLMDETWSWNRFKDEADSFLEHDIPGCSSDIGRPISLRFFPYDYKAASPINIPRRTFVSDGGLWFERHVGSAKTSEIADYIRELYTKDH